MSVFVSEKEFRRLTGEALDSLPPAFREVLENVSVVVEDWPSDEELAALGLDPEEETIFGLYQGVALAERGLDYTGLPDRVVLYRMPILEACGGRDEVRSATTSVLTSMNSPDPGGLRGAFPP